MSQIHVMYWTFPNYCTVTWQELQATTADIALASEFLMPTKSCQTFFSDKKVKSRSIRHELFIIIKTRAHQLCTARHWHGGVEDYSMICSHKFLYLMSFFAPLHDYSCVGQKGKMIPICNKSQSVCHPDTVRNFTAKRC